MHTRMFYCVCDQNQLMDAYQSECNASGSGPVQRKLDMNVSPSPSSKAAATADSLTVSAVTTRRSLDHQPQPPPLPSRKSPTVATVASPIHPPTTVRCVSRDSVPVQHCSTPVTVARRSVSSHDGHVTHSVLGSPATVTAPPTRTTDRCRSLQPEPIQPCNNS